MSEPTDDPRLLELALQIADEAPVDWETARRTAPDLDPDLEFLRALDRIAEGHRLSEPAAPQAEPARFTWGSLRALEPSVARKMASLSSGFEFPHSSRDEPDEPALKKLTVEPVQKALQVWVRLTLTPRLVPNQLVAEVLKPLRCFWPIRRTLLRW